MIQKKEFYLKSLIFCLFLFLIFNNFLNSSSFANSFSNNRNAFGSEQNAIVQVLCNVITLLTGNIARAVAVIAIVVVAIGLFLGKFSWGVGLATAIGIAMIFGASNVVDWLVNGIARIDKGLDGIDKLCQ
jgi:type IV secretion system protein VirB2